MTNKDKFLAYTDGLCSPQNYVEWSWRFIIAAALQRRVWYGAEHMKLYANDYMVLFGPPGTGKSLVLKVIDDFLKFHKKKDVRPKKIINNAAEQTVLDSMEKHNLDNAESALIKSKSGAPKPDAPLFMYCPDATTYEALVEYMGMCFRRINIPSFNLDGTQKLGIYGHCSMHASLDEIGSLFKKHADAVLTYLLGMHGCPDLYEYKTKNNGEDRVINGCLNFIAGATPDTMEELSNIKLIGSGFAARVKFICANKNRKSIDTIPELSNQQKQYRLELLEHIKGIALLYGECKVGEDSRVYMEEQWKKSEEHRELRTNKNPKMEGYYARWNIHHKKAMMQNHFGESLELFISHETVVKTYEDLRNEEPMMHLALSFDKLNPLAKLTRKVHDDIIKYGGRGIVDLISEYWDDLPQGNKSMDEILQHLIAMDKIWLDVKEDGERIYKEKK